MEHRTEEKSGRKKRRAEPNKGKTRPRTVDAMTPVEAEAGRDYTPEILEFLGGAHGSIRIDGNGDYYYEHVSTISLHFLMRSRLPTKELLWRWYQHFEQQRAESVYQTLPPLRDEEFLDILSTCDFAWDMEAVKESGLVFLSQHRKEVYLTLEVFLAMRLEAYDTMGDAELAEVLTPNGTWSEKHLKKLIQSIQTESFTRDERQSIYDQLESDYLKATARNLIDEALGDGFWKSPPPELDDLHSRFIIFARTMTNTARRLGVYTSRGDFENREQAEFRRRRANGAGGTRGRTTRNGTARNGTGRNAHLEFGYYQLLGLEPGANLAEVKTAYRDMVKQHHPDQGGAVPDFLHLQEAYEYLLTHVY